MMKRYQSGEHCIGTQENIRAIMCHIASDAKTTIDIGCNEALISCALDNMGLSVHAYEAHESSAVFANEFITRNKQYNISFYNKALGLDDIKNMDSPDVGLLLSVHHQIAQQKGIRYANIFLQEFYKKINMQLFFQPALIYSKYHCEMPFPENDILSCFSYFVKILKASNEPVNAEIINITHNFMPPQEQYRPLFVFSKSVFPKGKRTPTMEIYAEEPVKQQGHLVYVNIDKVVTPISMQSFATGKWHYMVEACKDILAGKSNSESSLHQYYDKIAPSTIGELFAQAGMSQDIGFMREWPVSQAPMPFIFQNKPWEMPLHEAPEAKRHHFGPHSEETINYHVELLRDLIDSIKKRGYCPDLHIDGHICGIILKNGEECRFAVLSGQHRLAVLSSLDYKYFIAKLYPGFMPLLDRAQVKHWPMVKNGTFTTDHALAFFDGAFSADGSWCKRLCAL